MPRDPLRTKLCDMLGIEYPIIAFTHCKDVAVAVINAGAFAVLGEAMHTPDEIAADIRWIRERINGKPYGIDLVLPGTSSPLEGGLDDLESKIPASHREFAAGIAKRHDVPEPKGPVALHRWGGLISRWRGRSSTSCSTSEFRSSRRPWEIPRSSSRPRTRAASRSSA